MEYRKPLVGILFVIFTAEISASESNIDRDNYCPSSCDSSEWHTAFWCLEPPYCCLHDNELTCCYNDTLKLNGRWNDNHNCHDWLWWEHYWKFILGAGIALGGITLICSILLIAYQINYERKRRRRYAERELTRAAAEDNSAHPSNSVDNPVFTVEHLGPISPPPYTADKPPAYSITTSG